MADLTMSVLSGLKKLLKDIGGGAHAEVVASIPHQVDSTGAYPFNPDSLPKAYTWNADGTVATITYGPDANGNSFRETYTYTNGTLTSTSAPVKL